MVVAAMKDGVDLRSNRLTTLVSDSEGEAIAKKADAAGLSVSAYLRAQALGSEADPSGEAALRQVDLLIDRMESDLDGAIAELAAAMARMEIA